MKRFITKKSVIIACVIMVLVLVGIFSVISIEQQPNEPTDVTLTAQTDSITNEKIEVDDNFSYYKKLNLSNHLYVIRADKLSSAEIVMLETLQGIVAQDKAEIYLEMSDNYKKWLEDLKTNYNITYEYVASPWDLLEKFKSKIKDNGFIVYKANTDSINVACTLSGVLKNLAIDETLVDAVQKHGFVQKMDVRDKDEMWVFENYKQELNNKVVFQQIESNPALRDYGAAVKGLYYYETISIDQKQEIFGWLQPDSPVFGWGPGSEDSHIGVTSTMQLFAVASDHAYNLSTFSGINAKEMKQKEPKQVNNTDQNVHYVTFIMSDGDNIQWLVNSFPFANKWFANENRGKYPVGWSISPSTVDVAPNVMKYLYDKATNNDYFVASVSGNGYMFPSDYGDEELSLHTARLNKYLKRTDLKYVSILDNPDKSIMEKYAAQDNVAGGFYFTGDKYVGANGAIYWANNKPFVAARESLWLESPSKLAVRLNSYKRDPKSIEGYTVINVHPWSEGYDDIIKTINKLDGHVKVVLPDEFMKLIEQNVEKTDVEQLNDVDKFDYKGIDDQNEYIDLDKLSKMPAEKKFEFTFDKDFQGWETGLSGKEYDSTIWGDLGNGSLRMDGSDAGTPDTLPNSWFFKKIALPASAKLYLNFETRSGGPANDTNLRVRIVDKNNKIQTLFPWTLIKGEVWQQKSIDISAYAGQNATIYIEQNDSGEGNGEILFVDNIKILSSAAKPAPTATTNPKPVVISTVASTDYDYDFPKDTDGWNAGTGQKAYDKAQWGDLGAGSLRLDGSDLGTPDKNPNSWFFKKIKLPVQDKLTLAFDTRSGGPDNDSNLRVRLLDESNKSYILMDWYLVKGETWLHKNIDLSKYKGKSVTIYFEQNDSGEGMGEIIFVDNLKITWPGSNISNTGGNTTPTPTPTPKITANPAPTPTPDPNKQAGLDFSYSFSTGVDSWVGGSGKKAFDKAQWGDLGEGSLRMDGSDLGTPDSDANAWFSKKITLPSKDSLTLSFDARSGGPDNDAKLRVKVVDSNNKIYVLIDWVLIKGEEWINKSIDLSKFKGQTITIYFEQNDSGEGMGEIIFVDNVSIK